MFNGNYNFTINDFLCFFQKLENTDLQMKICDFLIVIYD